MLPTDGVAAWLDALASPAPTPGGGGAAALTLAQAAALLAMACRLTLGKEKYASTHAQVAQVLDDVEAVRQAAQTLAAEDAQAFQKVMDAYALPRQGEGAAAARNLAIQAALEESAGIPLAVYQLSGLLLLEGGPVRILEQAGNPALASDVAVGRILALASLHASLENLRANTVLIKEPGLVSALEQELIYTDQLEQWNRELMEHGNTSPASGTLPPPGPGLRTRVGQILREFLPGT